MIPQEPPKRPTKVRPEGIGAVNWSKDRAPHLDERDEQGRPPRDREFESLFDDPEV